jgi:hypothetical protein
MFGYHTTNLDTRIWRFLPFFFSLALTFGDFKLAKTYHFGFFFWATFSTLKKDALNPH